MKVFKFGGASVNSVDRIRKLGEILSQYAGEKILVVISAMGKTTNALEKVTEAFYAGKKEEALQLFNLVKQQHLSIAKYLLIENYLACEKQLHDFFTEAEWLLHDRPQREYAYYYDQVVCTGELFSTAIISHYLNQEGIKNTWVDVRDIFRTDDDFRNAAIEWDETRSRVLSGVVPLFKDREIVLTQGFIGATDENESTTLGREGSDYSAAVFTHILDAESLTIWKDVESVMNADPKKFPDAIPIPRLSYEEVIEMAYYGAQVIHPNTIKPMQNKKIPLYVKCFLDPSLPGTLIDEHPVHGLPPVIVLKENQVMMKMSARDFSFVGEHHIGRLFHLFEDLHIKPNLTQNGAISILTVMDNLQEKVGKLAAAAAEFLDVNVQMELSLLTIRHYTTALFEKMTAGKKIILRQQTEDTVQVLMQ